VNEEDLLIRRITRELENRRSCSEFAWADDTEWIKIIRSAGRKAGRRLKKRIATVVSESNSAGYVTVWIILQPTFEGEEAAREEAARHAREVLDAEYKEWTEAGQKQKENDLSNKKKLKAVSSPKGPAPEGGWTEDAVTRVIINPIYAVNIHEMLSLPHEPVLSEKEWIAANVKMIKHLGAEQYLRCLLDVLKGNYT
jgi:hypothetical protein